MNVDDETLQWIEDFYTEMESGFDNYIRPTDYVERALRLINKRPNTVGILKEGLTTRGHHE